MVITNPKKTQRKLSRKRYIKLEAFRPTKEVKRYLNCVYNKSQFINRSIYFYIKMIHRPIEILKDLKNLHPKLYKFVGRRRFK